MQVPLFFNLTLNSNYKKKDFSFSYITPPNEIIFKGIVSLNCFFGKFVAYMGGDAQHMNFFPTSAGSART